MKFKIDLEEIFEKYKRKGPAVHIKNPVTPVKILIVSSHYKKPFYRTYYVTQESKLHKYRKIISAQRASYTGNIEGLKFYGGWIYHKGNLYNLDAYLFYEHQKPSKLMHIFPSLFKKYDSFENLTGIRDLINRKYLTKDFMKLLDYRPNEVYDVIDEKTKDKYNFKFERERISNFHQKLNVYGSIFTKDNKRITSNFSIEYKGRPLKQHFPKSVTMKLTLRKNNKYDPKMFGYMFSRHLNLPELDRIEIDINELKKAKQYLLSHFIFMGFEFGGVKRENVNKVFKEIKEKYKKLFQRLEHSLWQDVNLSQDEILFLRSNDFYKYITALMKSKAFEYKELNSIFYEMQRKLRAKYLVLHHRDKRSLSEIRLHRYNVLNNTLNDYHFKYHFREL